MTKLIAILFTMFITISNGYTQNDTTRNDDPPRRNTVPAESEYNPQYASIKRKVIRGFSFQAENDVFAKILMLKNEDKDYTGGFKFEFYTDYLAKGIFPFFMNRDDPYDMSKNVNSIYIQGMGYTPNRDAFSATNPVIDQRPYSSVIGIGRKRIAILNSPLNRKLGLIIISDLFLGKIGTKGPGKVQNFLHEYLTNSAEVKGWPNQIGNGGRFVYNYNLTASAELFAVGRNHYVITTLHSSIGNLFINQGAKLAFSNLSVRKQPFTLTMNSNQVAKEGDKIQKARSYDSISQKKEKKFHYELYGKFYHINHNTLLMGLPFRDNSVYTIPKSRINQIVVDAGFKLYFSYSPDKKGNNKMNRKNLVYLEILYRSKEFDIAPTHFYGGIGVQILSLD